MGRRDPASTAFGGVRGEADFAAGASDIGFWADWAGYSSKNNHPVKV
jgi:hypothetical protein